MKFLHKYSCEENPNRIEILLKKCKHILSNNKLKEHKEQIYQLITVIKKLKMIIRILFFYLYC